VNTAEDTEGMEYTDLPRSIALRILADRKREDIRSKWLTFEVMRQYTKAFATPPDPCLVRYASGGIAAMTRKMLKRNVEIAGLIVPERLFVSGVYRPTIICTVQALRENVSAKRKAVAYDIKAIDPVERLADILEESGRTTVGDLDQEG